MQPSFTRLLLVSNTLCTPWVSVPVCPPVCLSSLPCCTTVKLLIVTWCAECFTPRATYAHCTMQQLPAGLQWCRWVSCAGRMFTASCTALGIEDTMQLSILQQVLKGCMLHTCYVPCSICMAATGWCLCTVFVACPMMSCTWLLWLLWQPVYLRTRSERSKSFVLSVSVQCWDASDQ